MSAVMSPDIGIVHPSENPIHFGFDLEIILNKEIGETLWAGGVKGIVSEPAGHLTHNIGQAVIVGDVLTIPISGWIKDIDYIVTVDCDTTIDGATKYDHRALAATIKCRDR